MGETASSGQRAQRGDAQPSPQSDKGKSIKTGIKVTVELFVPYTKGDMASLTAASARAQKLTTFEGLKADDGKGLQILACKTVTFNIPEQKAAKG